MEQKETNRDTKKEIVFDAMSDIKHKVLNHPVMTHPFWQRFRQGALSTFQLRAFSLQYYQHVKRTRLYAAAVLARTPIEEIQSALTSILWDEYGQGNIEKTHPAQFRKMLRSLDLREADWEHTEPLPELEMYSDIHFRLCTQYNFWTGLGVVGIAMELPIPTLYQYLVEGFTRSGLKEDILEFFIEHGPMDIQHAGLLNQAMRPHLKNEEDPRALCTGALRSLDARSILMDGMFRSVWGHP